MIVYITNTVKILKINSCTKIGQHFGMVASDAEAKFKNLRSFYTRFSRKRQNMPSGSGADAIKKQESEFAAFEWLFPHIATTLPISIHIPTGGFRYIMPRYMN